MPGTSFLFAFRREDCYICVTKNIIYIIMKKIFIVILAALAMAISAGAQVHYPQDPVLCENLYLELKADTLYFYHDGFDGPYYSYYRDNPPFLKGQMFEWTGENEAKCFREFLENEGRSHGMIYENILVYADNRSTVSFAVELSKALYGLIGLENVVFIIPPKYWHDNPVSMLFSASLEFNMTMEEFLAEQEGETMGVTFNMYEEGQGLWKPRHDGKDMNYHQNDIHDLVCRLDTGEEYPYVHIKVPKRVTLSDYVASMNAFGEAKQDNPMRIVETCYVPDSASENVIDFDYYYVHSHEFVRTVDAGRPIFAKDFEELGIQSLPVFSFSYRGESFECTPGSYYYNNGEKMEPYTFWAGSRYEPKAQIGSYFMNFTVCADGSVKDIEPEADYVHFQKPADWEYAMQRVCEEPYWRPALDLEGKPVNLRLYGVRVFLTF